MPFHWPGHCYLGPGTEDHTPEPLDEDDRIAQGHDLDYEAALTPEDIRQADRTAISSFTSDFFHTGNYHSAIGAIGLSGKYALDTILGKPVYPDMNRSGKGHYYRQLYAVRQRFLAQHARDNNISYRDAQANQSEILRNNPHWDQEVNNFRQQFETPASFERASDRIDAARRRGPLATSTQRPGPSNEDTTVDVFENMEMFQNMMTGQQNGNSSAMDVADGTEKRSVGGGGGQTIGDCGPAVMGQSTELQILHNPSIPNTQFTIRHSHLFQTWGYKYHMYENTTSNGKSYLLHYPLALVPVDFLPFYLTPQEFQNLPNGTFIEEVFVKITPKGIRCSFDTASTLSGHANNQQTIFGITGVGLNHKFLLRHRKIKANTSHPMDPSYETIKDEDMNHIVTRMWGSKTADADFKSQFPTSLWTIRSHPFYTGFVLPSNDGNTHFTMDTGHIDLTNHTSVFNILDHKDQPCLNYSYKPKFSPLKVKSNISSTDSIIGASHTWQGNIQSIGDVHVTSNGGKLSSKVASGSLSWVKDNEYMVPVEQSFYKTTSQHQFHTMSQPQVHLGILPVQSNAPSDVDASFVNTSALYYIETEIKLNSNINTLFNRADVFGHTKAVYDRDYSINGMYNVEHVSGLLSNKKE